MSRKAALNLSFQSRLLLQRCDNFRHSTPNDLPPLKRRCFSHSPSTASTQQHQNNDSSPDPGELRGHVGHKAREKEADKEFFLNLLSSVSTKREAKSYLARFNPPKKPAADSPQAVPSATDGIGRIQDTSSSLDMASEDTFKTSQEGSERSTYRKKDMPILSKSLGTSKKLHIALVKIKDPQLLDDKALHGVARTLSQLSMLGMSCCVVIDTALVENGLSWRESAEKQADRLATAIDWTHGPDSRRLDSAVSLSSESPEDSSVFSRNLLLSPLVKGQIVVTIPIGYVDDTQRAIRMPANDVVLALAKEFAGLNSKPSPEENVKDTAQRIKQLQQQISLDRLIILDPLGGTPSLGQARQASHVFVNLEQEYIDIAKELELGMQSSPLGTNNGRDKEQQDTVSPLGKSNPLSQFVEEELVTLPHGQQQNKGLPGNEMKDELEGHLANLKLLQQTLSYLPPSSSGLITTPYDAANFAKESHDFSQSPTVGTRRQRNPLIHNLLTDKPIHSASLPPGRLGANNDNQSSSPPRMTHSTFVKRGMPLTIFPDPRVKFWTSTNNEEPRINLDDPRIDLPRLVYLIEDSFNRKLDVKHYMNRVHNRLAGLIIAGEYEGGAILTWETPPGVPDDGSPESKARMVPYLDKFAVLKRSQGSGGVADMVFNAMVRTCFPNGLCWRSRRNNPVNKWYFERSRGTWKLPSTAWTMFWTTDRVPENERLFSDYEAVCRSIEPSWADNKQEVD